MWRRIFLSILLLSTAPAGQEVLKPAGILCFLSSPLTISDQGSSSNKPDSLVDESRYQWSSETQGIESIRDAILRYRPSILARYGTLGNLSREEIKILKDDIYAITHGHFQVWGLSRAMDQRSAPYFGGSHIGALIKVFSRLGLNPLGFGLDWSKERGIESVRYVLSREVPGIIERYDRLDKLTVKEIGVLRNNIYGITQGHFKVWGLSKAMDHRSVPYFDGSHIGALMKVFSDPRLGLTKEGFLENSHSPQNPSEENPESLLEVVATAL